MQTANACANTIDCFSLLRKPAKFDNAEYLPRVILLFFSWNVLCRWQGIGRSMAYEFLLQFPFSIDLSSLFVLLNPLSFSNVVLAFSNSLVLRKPAWHCSLPAFDPSEALLRDMPLLEMIDVPSTLFICRYL